MLDNGGPLDLAFLIDNTVNVSPTDWTLMTSFMTSFLQQLNVGPLGTRVAIVKFSDTNISQAFQLNPDNLTVLTAITKLTQVSVTRNATTAIGVLRGVFTGENNRADAPNVAIVVTSGVPSPGSLVSTTAAARIAKEAGIQMFVVGVGSKVNTTELADMAASPKQLNDTYFMLPGFEELAGTTFIDRLVKRICVFHRLYLCMQFGYKLMN